MKKFEITRENAPFIAQAFETNPSNAKSIIKSRFDITDEDFNQIWANYNFDKLKSYLPDKKKRKLFTSDRSKLKKDGVFIDSENKSISCPFDKIKDCHVESIKNLVSIGFTVQHTTFELF